MKKLYSFLTGIVLVILVLWGISHQIEASMNTKNSDKLVKVGGQAVLGRQ